LPLGARAAGDAVSVAVATAAAAGAPGTGDGRAAFGLRRPLVGRDGQVAGFELRFAAALESRLGDRADDAAAAQATALMTAARLGTAGGRQVLLSLPGALLDRPAIQQQATQGVWLGWRGGTPRAASLAALRARGARVGAPEGAPEQMPAGAADFVWLRAQGAGLDTLLLAAQRWREAHRTLAVVATGLGGVDEIEQALRGGVALAGGDLGCGAAAPAARPLGAAAHRICELLNHLALDRDTVLVADAVRGDTALTYRLLRYANSAAIGLKRSVTTVDDAVTMLGRSELQRWLTVQLMSAAASRQASRALEEAALARGRVLEAVARRRGDASPGTHFTLGMLSLMEPLLQVPLASALAPLRLGDAAGDALLRRAGPWADRLQLLDAIDAGDEAKVGALCGTLGVGDDLDQIVEAAWRWAAQVRQSADK